MTKKRQTDNCLGVRCSGGIGSLTINGSGVNDPNDPYLVRRGLDGPRASGWYGRPREPISLFSVLNSDQLWQLSSLAWTILLPIVIYNLDSGITAKYSKQQASFYSMQVSFRFHSLRCSEILVSPSICTKIRTRRFLIFCKLTHYPYLDDHLCRIWDEIPPTIL